MVFHIQGLDAVGVPVHKDAEEIAEDGAENKQQNEESRSLEIEKEADKEEVAVADGEFKVGPLGVVGAALEHSGPKPRTLQQTESGKDNEKEGPEVELGEKERMHLVV